MGSGNLKKKHVADKASSLTNMIVQSLAIVVHLKV